MTQPRILIACIGNIFFGDDAFGVEVARRLATCRLPEEVCVIDFGIRGLDLAYALLEGYETVILVDAVPRGGEPGSIYLMELDFNVSAEHLQTGTSLEMHHLDPVKVLRLAAGMGAKVERLLMVGCEPQTTSNDEDLQDGLSEVVRVAADQAIGLIEALVNRLLNGDMIRLKRTMTFTFP